MAVAVALGGVLLNSAADPSDAVQLEATLDDTPDTGGSVSTYGGGRLRWVQGQAVTRKVALTLDTVTPAQLAWLEAHKGALLCLRDPTGRRYWGTFGTFTASPYLVGGYHDVTGLTFMQVTRYESV